VALVTAAASATVRPARQRVEVVRRAARPFAGQPAAIVGLMVLLAFLAVALAGLANRAVRSLAKTVHEAGRLKRLLPPSRGHLLGTTLYGRDVLARS